MSKCQTEKLNDSEISFSLQSAMGLLLRLTESSVTFTVLRFFNQKDKGRPNISLK